MTNSNLDRANVRILQLDSVTSFPILEALEIQFGDWTFWATLVSFIIIVFMAWKEKCLSLPSLPYIIFVLIIVFSYYMIPVVIIYGAYCFRAQIKSMMNGSGSKPTITLFPDKGTEMTERLISQGQIVENVLKNSPRFPRETISERPKRTNPSQQIYTERPVKSSPPMSDPLAEKERQGFFKEAGKKICSCFLDSAKENFNVIKDRGVQFTKDQVNVAKDRGVQFLKDQTQNALGNASKLLETNKEAKPSNPLRIDKNKALEQRKLKYSDQWDEEFRKFYKDYSRDHIQRYIKYRDFKQEEEARGEEEMIEESDSEDEITEKHFIIEDVEPRAFLLM